MKLPRPNSPELQALQEELEQYLPADQRHQMMADLPRLETLFQLIEDDPLQGTTEARAQVMRYLGLMWQALNCQLGLICQSLGYFPAQVRWDDSKPLEIMVLIFPGLNATTWYQRQLSEIVMPTGSPLLRIITLEGGPPSAGHQS